MAAVVEEELDAAAVCCLGHCARRCDVEPHTHCCGDFVHSILGDLSLTASSLTICLCSTLFQQTSLQR
eukprot:3322827-Amphidinium_carterae.1